MICGVFYARTQLRKRCRVNHQVQHYLIPIKGDSMLPNYSSGDIVACQRINAQSTFFQWGKVYVVDTEQGVLIKRLFEGTSHDTIRLVSDNAKYSPIEVPRTKIYHMSVILGTLRLE